MNKQERLEMRVKIAQDVLKMLVPREERPKKDRVKPELEAECSVYLSTDNEPLVPHEGEETNLKTLLRARREPCRVCAIGAMFVAEVDRNNKLHIGDPDLGLGRGDDSMGDWFMRERLSTYFTKKELTQIECIFEEWGNNATLRKISNAFDAEGVDEKGRMKALMQHIVKNEGEIKITKFVKELRESTEARSH